MRHAVFSLVALSALSACQPTEPPPLPPPSAFDVAVDSFTALLCEVGEVCVAQDPVACEADVSADLADAKDILDDAGEAACAACLDVKSTELQKLLDAQCDVGVLNNAAVFGACDLDPAVDFDGDGVTDNDDEACAGFP